MKELVGFLLILALFQPIGSFGQGSPEDANKALAANEFAPGADGFKDAEKLFAAASPVKLKEVGHYPWYFKAECTRDYFSEGKISYATAGHANIAFWDSPQTATEAAYASYEVFWGGKQVYSGGGAEGAPGLPLLATKLTNLGSGELGGDDSGGVENAGCLNKTTLRKLTLGNRSYWVSYNLVQYDPNYKSPFTTPLQSKNDWAVTYCKFLNK